jgi:hypothetical protein
MIRDTQLQLASAQSIAAAAGDVASTNIIDTGAAQDVGIGEEVELAIRTVAAVTSGGAATVQFVLQTDTATNFATAMVEFPLTGAIALAALTANTLQYKGRLPYGLKRYLRVVARIAAAATTGGTMDAELVLNNDAQQYLPKNYTIS